MNFKKLLAECIGTFVLVFAACGVAALTGGSLVATAMTFGLVIVAMAYSIGRVSGCHVNPAVSLGCAIAGRMSWIEFLGYVCAQIVGGFLGGVAIFGIVKMAGINRIGNACNGVIGGDVTAGAVIGSLLAEIILTCIFVYVILNVTDENAGTSKKAGVVIGFTLTLVHLIGIPLTGTSVNPARSLATALNAWIFDGTTDALAQVWIFIVAPLAGAALAALLYAFLNKEKAAENKDAE
ncbi:MAG: aquaporin [Clostridia bacterium]|nr:aquaporin [Clostridia bacterium]